MTRRVNIDQWTYRDEPPVIVWVYTGFWELLPVAVNDSHDNDVYSEYAAAFLASGYYQTWDEVIEEYRHEYTVEQIEELYSRGDGSADRAGLPHEYYIEGAAEDISDLLIYIDEQTEFETRRESWEDALPYLDPESVNEIYQKIYQATEEDNAAALASIPAGYDGYIIRANGIKQQFETTTAAAAFMTSHDLEVIEDEHAAYCIHEWTDGTWLTIYCDR